MLIEEEKKPGVEEKYVAATSSSSLRCEADHNKLGSIETIAAAGMSGAVAGTCFIRLHGEWTSSEKPRPPTPEAVRKLAESLTFDQLVKMRADLKLTSIGNLKPSAVLAHMAAEAQVRAWYVAEVEMLMGKLKSFRSALAFMVGYLQRWDNRPEAMLRQTALEVLVWWLDKRCRACGGTKWETAAGTNRHTARACKACAGLGDQPQPRGDDGHRLEGYIMGCISDARGHIQHRLRRK